MDFFFCVFFLLLLTTPKAMRHLEFLCKVSEVATRLEDEIRTFETPVTWPACYIYLDCGLIQSRFERLEVNRSHYNTRSYPLVSPDVSHWFEGVGRQETPALGKTLGNSCFGFGLVLKNFTLPKFWRSSHPPDKPSRGWQQISTWQRKYPCFRSGSKSFS